MKLKVSRFVNAYGGDKFMGLVSGVQIPWSGKGKNEGFRGPIQDPPDETLVSFFPLLFLTPAEGFTLRECLWW